MSEGASKGKRMCVSMMGRSVPPVRCELGAAGARYKVKRRGDAARPTRIDALRPRAIREIVRRPDLGADRALDLVGRDTRGRAFLVRLQGHRERDRNGDVAQLADRWQQICARIAAGG